MPKSDAYIRKGHPCREDFEWFGKEAGLVEARVRRILDKYTFVPDKTVQLVKGSRLTEKLQRTYLRFVQERVSWFVRAEKGEM